MLLREKQYRDSLRTNLSGNGPDGALQVQNTGLCSDNPEKYAPQYGGYCAYAVSQGKTADIDPAAWTIVNNKLYLNLNKDVQGLWEKDRDVYIRNADKNWPHFLSKK